MKILCLWARRRTGINSGRHLHPGIFAAASVWNKLPQEIRSATSLPVFRRRL